jgi:hypothetical protein
MSDLLHEDEVVGKALDLRLMRRLLRFLAPYRALFAVCVVLILILTGIQVGIPYISRLAIDRYLTLPRAIVTLAEPPESGNPIALGGGRYLVEVRAVPPRTVQQWEASKALGSERYLFVPAAAIVSRHPDWFTPVPGGAIAD